MKGVKNKKAKYVLFLSILLYAIAFYSYSNAKKNLPAETVRDFTILDRQTEYKVEEDDDGHTERVAVCHAKIEYKGKEYTFEIRNQTSLTEYSTLYLYKGKIYQDRADVARSASHFWFLFVNATILMFIATAEMWKSIKLTILATITAIILLFFA